jgi:hypothetical protein
MSKPSSTNSSDPLNNSLIVLAMLAMIAVPAGLALHTVHIPAQLKSTPADATPYGYAVSLLLFIVPIIVIGWWFVPQEGIRIPKQAFWRTILVLFLGGSSLEITSLPIVSSHTPTTRPRWGSQRPPWVGLCPLRSMSFTSQDSSRCCSFIFGSTNTGWSRITCQIIRRKQKSSSGCCSFTRHLWYWDWP